VKQVSSEGEALKGLVNCGGVVDMNRRVLTELMLPKRRARHSPLQRAAFFNILFVDVDKKDGAWQCAYCRF
jgi:hypothetical protein